jgi:phage terminase large subunit-like protein
MLPSRKAINYAKDVASGAILTNKWVKLACERFLNDLERKDWDYYFDFDAADRVVRFMEKLPHVKGVWASRRENLKLEPWQCFIECNLFGFLHKESKKRRFRRSFELIPRKNAKSTRAAARGIYMFGVDNESGAEVYCGATSERQAQEVFRPAWQMVNALPAFRSKFSVQLAGSAKNPRTIYRLTDMSKFEMLIGKPGDGASPHCAIIDEYHEHDTSHMVETMQTGMGARQQPLLSVISTAGSNLSGPCYEMQQEMERILTGVDKDDTTFAIMYGIDVEDDWSDPRSLVKANPNFNVSVFSEFLLDQLEQAKRSAAKQNSFRTKHLNEWVGAKTAWMDMYAWARQVKQMVMEDFKDCFCHVASDLSSKKDITAVDVTFEKSGHYYSFKKFFAPEAAAEANPKYRDFSLTGHLELTDGFMIDQKSIEDYLIWLGTNFKVVDYTFDEWQADYMMTRLAKLKAEVVKFPFNTKNVSTPMKQIEALVLDGKYWHDNNPVMNWMVGNVSAKLNAKNDIYPNKARPNDPLCKKDGVDAAIMSMGRWMVQQEPAKEYKVFFV